MSEAQGEENDNADHYIYALNPLGGIKAAPGQKEYDSTMRIFLSGRKPTYGPNEKPIIDVCFKNESKETVYMKRIWSDAQDDGITFKSFLDDREQVSSGILSRKSTLPDSSLPADAVKLAPNGKTCVMTFTLVNLSEGEHSLRIEYSAFFRVAERVPRKWWNGNARSNDLTMRVSRVLPEKALSEAASDVINNIHFDIKLLKSKYPSLSGYNDKCLNTKTKGLFHNIPVIEFSTLKPARRIIRVYFQQPEFQSGSFIIFDEPFPYLGIRLFAHIDAEDEPSLRNALLSIVTSRKKSLYKFTANSAKQISVDLEPFGPELSKAIRRSAFIVSGTVKSKKVEDPNQYNMDYRMWLIEINVNEVFAGEVKDKKIIAKAGALSSVFGQDDIIGRNFVFLFADKNNWQKEFVIIGAEPASDNIISWLRAKTGKK